MADLISQFFRITAGNLILTKTYLLDVVKASAANKMIFARCTWRAGNVLFLARMGQISSGILTVAAINGIEILSLCFSLIRISYDCEKAKNA